MRKKTEEPERERSTAEYYRLNSKAIDDLIHADESNSPPVSEEELKKYRSGHKLKLADWVKLLLIKFWFYGATCFFFLWGLGIYIPNAFDKAAVLTAGMGFVTDLLTNNVIRFFASVKGGNDRWMMYPRKGFISLPLNLLHAAAVLFLVYNLYQLVNGAIISLKWAEEDSVPLGVGPILFGVFCTAFDMLLIKAKHLMQKIWNDAKQKVLREDASSRPADGNGTAELPENGTKKDPENSPDQGETQGQPAGPSGGV